MPSVASSPTTGSCAPSPSHSITPMPNTRQVSGAGTQKRCSARGITSSAKINNR